MPNSKLMNTKPSQISSLNSGSRTCFLSKLQTRSMAGAPTCRGGLRSRYAIRGRYSWQERTHREFNKWLVDRYRAAWRCRTGVHMQTAAE